MVYFHTIQTAFGCAANPDSLRKDPNKSLKSVSFAASF